MTTQPTLTKSQQTNADISALLRAKTALLWITTREELRVERALVEAAAAAKFEVTYWDCASGLTTASGKKRDNMTDPLAVLNDIRDSKVRQLYVMRDLHRWFDQSVMRTLRNLAKTLQGAPKNEARAIVILTPSADIPPELTGHVTVIDYPLPERPEIAALLDDVVRGLPEDVAKTALPEGTRDAVVDAAVGLTAEEASGCYARSLVTKRVIDPAVVAAEKRRVIAREKVLTWIEPDPRGLDAIGGLDVLKNWLVQRKLGLSQKARDYGIPAPRGVFLAGVPGTGKSLAAKAVATAWGIPLLKLDMGALQSKFVGESQANVRKAFAVAEAVAPCVLFVDEIEKALAGSTGPQGDGGVSADALGTLLTWMQERPVDRTIFVVATANEIRNLPPELLRKGRFDEMWFVDLPNTRERAEIAEVSLRAYKRDPALIKDIGARVAKATEGFTGAEIAALVPDALFTAFADGERELRAEDLLTAAFNIMPLSKTASERIDELRKWAVGRTKMASTPDDTEEKNERWAALDV